MMHLHRSMFAPFISRKRIYWNQKSWANKPFQPFSGNLLNDNYATCVQFVFFIFLYWCNWWNVWINVSSIILDWCQHNPMKIPPVNKSLINVILKMQSKSTLKMCRKYCLNSIQRRRNENISKFSRCFSLISNLNGSDTQIADSIESMERELVINGTDKDKQMWVVFYIYFFFVSFDWWNRWNDWHIQLRCLW